MVPPDSISRRAYFVGFAVAVGFRWFAVAGFVALHRAVFQASRSGLLPRAIAQTLWFSTFASVFFIPFFAGFLAAFWWRRVHWCGDGSDENKTLGASALLAWCPLLVFSWYAGLFVVALDMWFCGHGVKGGTKFWNSRMSRQFFGDFSTRDDETS